MPVKDPQSCLNYTLLPQRAKHILISSTDSIQPCPGRGCSLVSVTGPEIQQAEQTGQTDSSPGHSDAVPAQEQKLLDQTLWLWVSLARTAYDS